MSLARDHYESSSRVPADVDTVWAHCSSMTGISRELWPWLRMTYPSGAESLVPRGRFSGATTAFALAVPLLFQWRHHRLQWIFKRELA